jgi:hypothetical protein
VALEDDDELLKSICSVSDNDSKEGKKIDEAPYGYNLVTPILILQEPPSDDF